MQGKGAQPGICQCCQSCNCQREHLVASHDFARLLGRGVEKWLQRE